MKKVLCLGDLNHTFCEQDLDMLHRISKLSVLRQNWSNPIRTVISLIYQILFLEWHIIFKDCVVVQFAGLWSVVPVLYCRVLRVPCYVFIHGTDAVIIDEIDYGIGRNCIHRAAIAITFKYATKVVGASATVFADHTTFGNPHVNYGALYSYPCLSREKTIVIPQGIYTCDYNFGMDNRRPSNVVTMIGDSQKKRKGYHLVKRLAEDNPDVHFIVIGMHFDPFAPINMKFTGRIGQHKMADIFTTSHIYIQLSYFEGFGMSIAEAMASGCFPLVSNVGCMPEIAGGNGKVVYSDDREAIQTAFRELYDRDFSPWDRESCYLHIERNFSYDKRCKDLHRLIYGT